MIPLGLGWGVSLGLEVLVIVLHLGLEVPSCLVPFLVVVLGVLQSLLGDLDLQDLRVGLGRDSQGGQEMCDLLPFPHLR